MSDERTPHCDHKFVDSKHCLKCGWVPPDERTPVYHVWQTWPVRVPTCSLCGVRQTDTNADRECSYRPTHDPRTPAQIADAMTDTRTQCPNCGADGGGHFVPPSFGEEGFYACRLRVCQTCGSERPEVRRVLDPGDGIAEEGDQACHDSFHRGYWSDDKTFEEIAPPDHMKAAQQETAHVAMCRCHDFADDGTGDCYLDCPTNPPDGTPVSHPYTDSRCAAERDRLRREWKEARG